jgi:hypothetical protein
MASKDVKNEMSALKKTSGLESGEKLINMYSKQEMEATGIPGSYHKKGARFFVHPEQVEELIKKGYAKKIGEEKTEVPELDVKKDPIVILT